MRITHTRWTRMLVVATVISGSLLTSTTASAQGGAAAPDVPDVKVSRLAKGRALVEVAHGGVAIRKEITAQASHVTISTPTDELQIRVTRGAVTISTPGGSATLADGRAEDIARFMALLQRSDAATRGRELLAGLPDNPSQFGPHALLLTRAILELGAGPSPALIAHRRWVMEQQAVLDRRAAGGTAAVRRVGLQSGGSDRGPSDCWDEYAKEAIRIADDFVDCFSEIKVLFPWSGNGCKLVYIVRSEAAMFWFIACSGGFPFGG